MITAGGKLWLGVAGAAVVALIAGSSAPASGDLAPFSVVVKSGLYSNFNGA